MNGIAKTFCGLTQSEQAELKKLNDQFCGGAAAFALTPEIEASADYKRLNALTLKKMAWLKAQQN